MTLLDPDFAEDDYLSIGSRRVSARWRSPASHASSTIRPMSSRCWMRPSFAAAGSASIARATLARSPCRSG
jgi:hypothetical protein